MLLKYSQLGCWTENEIIFLNIFSGGNFHIFIELSLKFVPMGTSPIDNKSTLIQLMDWYGKGDKPLPQPRLIKVYNAMLYHLLLSCIDKQETLSYNQGLF